MHKHKVLDIILCSNNKPVETVSIIVVSVYVLCSKVPFHFDQFLHIIARTLLVK